MSEDMLFVLMDGRQLTSVLMGFMGFFNRPTLFVFSNAPREFRSRVGSVMNKAVYVCAVAAVISAVSPSLLLCLQYLTKRCS